MGDARYRLELAEGFLAEARQDVQLQRWRSCVDNSQLAVENAARAVLALLGPVGHTHAVAQPLRHAVSCDQFASQTTADVSRLADLADQLDWSVHVESDYGDELGRRTPWEIFDETAARPALGVAEEAVEAGRGVVAAAWKGTP